MSHQKHPHESDVPTPAPSPQGEPSAPAPDDALAAKTRECAEMLDRLQRLAAEYANYQKRMARQMDDLRRTAARDLVLDLLPAIDDFERALEAACPEQGRGAKAETDFATFRDGIRLVHDRLLAALAKHGVTQVAAEAEDFDPEHHEAVAQIPSDTHPQGRVVNVARTGYRMNGQTIRPSRVIVSGGPAEKPSEAAPPNAGDASERTPEEERGTFDADL